MELEFTEEVSADAGLAAKYEVKTWTYTRTPDYGGSSVDQKSLTVSSVQVDASKKKVYLEIAGLRTGYLVYIRLVGLKSLAGKTPWSTETWYTLNAFGIGSPFDPTTSVSKSGNELGGSMNNSLSPAIFSSQKTAEGYSLRIDLNRPYTLSIMNGTGNVKATYRGQLAGAYFISNKEFRPGIYFANIESMGKSRGIPFIVP